MMTQQGQLGGGVDDSGNEQEEIFGARKSGDGEDRRSAGRGSKKRVAGNIEH